METKAVIFDMGGVVIDYLNSRDYYEGYLQKKFGIDAIEAEKFIEGKLLPRLYEARMTESQFYGEIAKKFGIRKRDVRWVENFVEKAKVNTGLIEIIKKLRQKYTTAFFSNVDNAVYVKMLELVKPYINLFDYRFASCKLGLAKPKHAAFRLVLGKMGIAPEQAVFTDNDKNNVKGAKETGIKAVLFKNNMQLYIEFRKVGLL